MLQGRVAPPAIVVRKREIRGTEVGRRDRDGAGEAPLGVVVAPHLIARTAAQAVVEQGGAKSRGVGSVPLAVQIPISARSTCIHIITHN